MIGSGLKKLAAENGMKVSKGIAYGGLCGYAATMYEGWGWKRICFSTTFPDAAQRGLLIDVVNLADIQKRYRVQTLNISSKNIVIHFLDTVGTMKKIREFLDWFIPLMNQHGATKMDICTECGMQITDGCWKLIGDIAYYMHSACAEKVSNQIADEAEQRKQDDEGSYGAGFVGAILGAAIGAVAWAVILNMGYVASVVGLLIGFLAEKGYTLLGGKRGKGKVIILTVAVVLGVVLGTLGADAFTLITMIGNGELYINYGDIPQFLLMLLREDVEYAAAVQANTLTGLLFAGIGVFAFLMKAGKEATQVKIIDLT